MDAATLLDTLTRQGLTLTAHGDRLQVRGTLTDRDRQTIRQHKPQLLAALQPRPRSAVTLPPTVEGIPLADLKREGAEDWPELASNPDLLRAFARSCIHTGTLRPRPADAGPWVEPCLSPTPADLRRRQEGGR